MQRVGRCGSIVTGHAVGKQQYRANRFGHDNAAVPLTTGEPPDDAGGTSRLRGSVVTFVVVLLLVCVAGLTVLGVWTTRRRSQVLNWNRELDAAFDGERRELPRGRIL